MNAMIRKYCVVPLTVVVALSLAALTVRADDLKQADDGSIKLTAENAKIVGSTAKVEGDDTKNIGYWSDAADYLEWTVNVEKPGTFTVEVNYALDAGSDGSEVALAAGDQTASGKLAATGGWGDYKPLTLGAVKVDKAGPVTITLKATKKPGDAVMNFRTADLKPAK